LKNIYFILILFFSLGSLAQENSEFRVKRSVPGDFSGFTADNLGNIYAITHNNQLKKYNPKSDSMGVFNDVRKYGKLTYIDAANPLKTLLFYKDFRTIVVLDRLLNIVNTIDLRKQNIIQVRAVAQSYDNNVWVFDEQESKLRKIGEDGRIISETADLRIVLDEAPVPVSIFDQNGFVYMYDPMKGMYVFDYYGALKNKLSLLNWTDVQVIGNNILGRKDGKLLQYTTGTLQLKETVLPDFLQKAENILLAPQGIFILEPTGIRLYSTQL
jgi:hypothetical protein